MLCFDSKHHSELSEAREKIARLQERERWQNTCYVDLKSLNDSLRAENKDLLERVLRMTGTDAVARVEIPLNPKETDESAGSIRDWQTVAQQEASEFDREVTIGMRRFAQANASEPATPTQGE